MKTRTGCLTIALLLCMASPVPAQTAPSTPAALTAKQQQCVNSCRARYRDCQHKKQIPALECQNVYRDCTQYSCTGLGPG